MLQSQRVDGLLPAWKMDATCTVERWEACALQAGERLEVAADQLISRGGSCCKQCNRLGASRNTEHWLTEVRTVCISAVHPRRSFHKPPRGSQPSAILFGSPSSPPPKLEGDSRRLVFPSNAKEGRFPDSRTWQDRYDSAEGPHTICFETEAQPQGSEQQKGERPRHRHQDRNENWQSEVRTGRGLELAGQVTVLLTTSESARLKPTEH